MKKIWLRILMVLFIVLGTGFTILYGNFSITYPKHTRYLVYSIISALEVILTTTAFLLHLKEKKGKWVNGVYVLTEITCLPVLFYFVIWVALFLL